MAERKAPKVKQQPDPESEAWNKLPWRKLEQHVYRIQKNIYRASQQGKIRKVQKLQKLLMKSEAARLLAVRRVTQDNQGKKTAGIDGVKSVRPAQRHVMVKHLHPKQWKRSKARPVRRVWIPKPGKKDEQRPLGIPIMLDRSKQALAKMALEPEWEARFESNSYGFRPGRSTHDAIEAIFTIICHKPRFVLDADIKGCFDNISQNALLAKLHTSAHLRCAVRAWLRAGVIDRHVFAPTEKGTPQGGVISPLLANIALHGMEQAVREGDKKRGEQLHLVRYADDLVILHSDKERIQKAAETLEQWLHGMGLQLHPVKTKITHTLTPVDGQVGFDFLGYTVRQFQVGKTHTGKDPQGKPLGFKTIIKPSKQAVKRHTLELKKRIRELQSVSQEAVIKALNPMIWGWANYYKPVACTKAFQTCDYILHFQLRRWGKKRHPKIHSQEVIDSKYWRAIEGRTWVFATANGTNMRTHTMTHQQKHVKVKGEASPYDGKLVYWSKRLKEHPLVHTEKGKLLKEQNGRCAWCDLYFVDRDEDLLEVDHIIPRALGGTNELSNKRIYHRHCHDAKTVRDLSDIRERKTAGIVNT